MAEEDSTFRCNVKDYRMAKGWSQKELAEKINLRRQAVYDIESGRYLPNTGIALRLAKIFGCRVEDLFTEEISSTQPLHSISGDLEPSARLVLGRVRGRLVALPLQGPDAIPFGLGSADGFLNQDGQTARILSPSDRLDKTVILMGCDPAFQILSDHVARQAPDARVYCRFASSHRALDGLAQGIAHVAGTHLHNSGESEANVTVAGEKLAGKRGIILGFSLLEEGFMVARGNPLGIRTVADLADPSVRFVNREKGAALRVLLDDCLDRSGLTGSAINGYHETVSSHREGAYRIVCNVADAALGLRAIAEAFGLGFVPVTAVRCDLVFPEDMVSHVTVKILLDVLQSMALRNEINTIPGYDASVTGKTVSEV